MIDKWFGILPNKILFNKKLSDKQKLLFVYITSLCAEKGYCWASNKYISENMWCSENTISVNISKLKELWFIEVNIIQSSWNQRKILISENEQGGLLKNQKRSFEKSKEGSFEKSKDNNIIYNNINKNILSKDNIIYKPKNNFDYSFINEFLNKEHPIIKYQIEKDWLEVYLWKQYEVVDKLIKDWFTLEQIQLSCLFIKQDDFWKNNILTIKKLRQKNKDWVPYIVVILWKAKDFIEEKQNRTYQKTFLYGNWQNYVSN